MFSTSQTAILSPNNCLMKVFIATFLVCANAHAALINYSEGAGDLDSAFTTSFTVDMAGVHSWSGSASIFDPQAGIAVSEIDFDSFQLVVDPGFAITTVDLAISGVVTHQNTVEQSAQVGIITMGLPLNAIVYAAEEEVFNLSTGPHIFPADELPFGAGTYAVGTGPGFTGCQTLGAPCGSSWDWALTMQAIVVDVDDENPVPLPAPLSLIILGLLTLGCTRYKSTR